MQHIIKLEEIVKKNVNTYAPKLSRFYTSEKIIDLLKDGEKIADYLLKDRSRIEAEFEQEIERKRKDTQLAADQARSKAYEEGLNKAREEVFQKFDDFISFIEQSKESLIKELNKMHNLEKEIVHLSMKIAQKLVQNELKVNKQLLSKLIRNVIDSISEQDHLEIQAHPDDIEMLKTNLDQIKKDSRAIKDFKVTENAAVSRGGAVFTMDSGRIDSQIESQLARMEESFFNE